MKEGSMLESAYRALVAEGKEMSFAALWAAIKADLDISEEEERQRISYFYTDLSLSGRFIVLSDNTWDLSERHVLADKENTHFDVAEAYSDINERDNDASDAEDEADLNQYLGGGVETPEEEELPSEEDAGDNKPREDASELLGRDY